jgi:4a-hydroxytetrahydrobiopterin dehydratase
MAKLTALSAMMGAMRGVDWTLRRRLSTFGVMGKPEKLSKEAVEAFIAKHAGWKRDGDTLTKTYTFELYGEGIGFAVQVAFAADKRDHHPDLNVGFGKVEVRWTTHDAGGISTADVEMASQVDRLYRR